MDVFEITSVKGWMDEWTTICLKKFIKVTNLNKAHTMKFNKYEKFFIIK